MPAVAPCCSTSSSIATRPGSTTPAATGCAPTAWRRCATFDVETATTPLQAPDRPPPWLAPFAATVQRTVPAYRRGGDPPTRFTDVPTTERADLVAAPWAFVPDDHPLDDMVVFTTTGTSDGRVAYVASTPATTASYAVVLRAVLRHRGLTLDGGPGRVAVAQVCWQRHTYTYASISTFLGQAGILKLNLNPDDWSAPDDRGRPSSTTSGPRSSRATRWRSRTSPSSR